MPTINETGYPKTPGLEAAAKLVMRANDAAERRSRRTMAGPERLIARIEQALSAADLVHDLARDLNDGPNAPELNKALAAYRKASRGLDLRSVVSSKD